MRSVAFKLAAVASVVAAVGLGLSGLGAYGGARSAILDLQLDGADRELERTVGAARSLFDARYPGEWRLVPVVDAPTMEIFNGNGVEERFRTPEALTHVLHKGDVPVLGNPAVQETLESISRELDLQLTIAQRIPPRRSPDPTVGEAPAGRALRIATTVGEPGKRALLTVMPTRRADGGAAAGSRPAFTTGEAYTGRADVAGTDSWTRYEALRGPGGEAVGIFYGGTAFAPFEAAAASAAAVVRSRVLWAAVLAVGCVALILLLVTRRLLGPLREVTEAARAIARGDLDQEVEARSRDEVGELARAFGETTAYLGEMADAVERLARGDLSRPPEPRSPADRLARSVAGSTASLRELVGTTEALVERLGSGDLRARADLRGQEGGYRELLEGLNQVLDAVVLPLQEMVEESSAVLERVGDGDLTARMTGSWRGSPGTVALSLNRALESMATVLEEVGVSADEVASAAGQINDGAQQLAGSSSQQAAGLEEISASVEELGGMAGRTAGEAREARSLVDSAATGSEAGLEAMDRLSAAVDRIRESSEATERIIRTIDEIAFQTNLLALNAAVEAARAGDAGRGFAVVAEEVRALALRSGEAARETGELLSRSAEHVEDGVSLNADVVGRLREIVEVTGRAREAVSTIASFADRQSSAVGQIRAGVEEMNGVVQATAAGAEESAGAAEELDGQAARLRELVGSFRTGGSGGGGAATRETSPSPASATPTQATRRAPPAPAAAV